MSDSLYHCCNVTITFPIFSRDPGAFATQIDLSYTTRIRQVAKEWTLDPWESAPPNGISTVSAFCGVAVVTSTQTDHATLSVAIARIYAITYDAG